MKIRQLILFLLSNSLLAQDWPQLSYYQEANKALKTSRNTVEAVFFGDSITEGWPQFNPAFFEMLEILREKGYKEGEDFRWMVASGAEHNEPAWAARVPEILRFFFPKQP